MTEERPKIGAKYAPAGFEFDPVIVRDFIRSQQTEKLYVILEDEHGGEMRIISVEAFLAANLEEVTE
jgi:hypothetical protein